MHFEILVEDQSGRIALNNLLPRIIREADTFRIHPYKGIGRIPKGLKTTADPERRILLDQLPRLLRGFGATFAGYPIDTLATVVLVCDLDRRCLKEFRQELLGVLDKCVPKPRTKFCIAVEEGEAWFLGDVAAIRKAYPRAKLTALASYKNDEICGTWQILADALYPGGSDKLKKSEYYLIGKEKCGWAERITVQMDIENNDSPSFCYFRDSLRDISDSATI